MTQRIMIDRESAANHDLIAGRVIERVDVFKRTSGHDEIDRRLSVPFSLPQE